MTVDRPTDEPSEWCCVKFNGGPGYGCTPEHPHARCLTANTAPVPAGSGTPKRPGDEWLTVKSGDDAHPMWTDGSPLLCGQEVEFDYGEIDGERTGLAELRALSDAAAPGEWFQVENTAWGDPGYVRTDHSEATWGNADAAVAYCKGCDGLTSGDHDRAESNARFIAAAVNFTRAALAARSTPLPEPARWTAQVAPMDDDGIAAEGGWPAMVNLFDGGELFCSVRQMGSDEASALAAQINARRSTPLPTERADGLNLDAIQDAVTEYAATHWPNLTVEVEALALAEEVGEMARAVVKRHHGNRGSREDWTAELEREVGDCLLVLCNLASIEGFRLIDTGRSTLARILARDIDHHPVAPTEVVG